MIENFSDLRFARQMLKSRSSSFTFECSREKAEAYSRSQNPAVIALCRIIADVEQADECVVTSYGFGAILTLCLSQLKKGDHILVSEGCFGSHSRSFNDYMKTVGVDVTYVEQDCLSKWQAGVCSTTGMAFMMASPTLSSDFQAQKIRQLSSLLQSTGFEGQDIQLVVDNTQQQPQYTQPLSHGADFVLYTSTHMLESQGKVVAGAICGRTKDMISVARCMKAARVCISPFNAWVILQSLGAENNQVLDHILGVGSKGDSDKVVSLRDKSREEHRDCQLL